MPPITTVLSTRNEWPYLPFLLDYLAGEGIDVIVIDNGSTDETPDALRSGRFANVTKVVDLPYSGVFEHSLIIERKMAEAAGVAEGWIINHDADEVMQSMTGLGGLRAEIERAEAEGFTAINLQEATLLPRDPAVEDHLANNLNYYHYRPQSVRLVRIWKAGLSGTMTATAGHRFEGPDVRLSPRELLMRHYIVRSQQHALDKYLHRRFAERELREGWHFNRVGLSAENLAVPARHANLKRIESFDDARFDLSQPLREHYWQWPR